jgi:hypothetical protein
MFLFILYFVICITLSHFLFFYFFWIGLYFVVNFFKMNWIFVGILSSKLKM